MFMLSVWPVLILLPMAAAFLTPSLPQPVKFPAERRRDAPVNSIFSGSLTHLLSLLCVSMKILSHASAKRKERKKEKKGLRVSNFPLLLNVFKWHRGREGVNMPRWSVYADEQHGTRQRRALWQLVRKVRRRCRPLRLERKFGHLGRVLKEAQRGQVRPVLDIRCCSDDV